MPTYITPHQAFVAVLRASGLSVATIPDPPERDYDWRWQPYYKDAKEPQPAFPFVVYDIPNSNGPEHTFGDSYPELLNVEVKVVGVNPWIHYLGSPWGDPQSSVMAFLDSLSDQPFVFNGARYICCRFIRKDWELVEDDTRQPDPLPGQPQGQAAPVYGNVYVARANYEMEIGATYPTRTRG